MNGKKILFATDYSEASQHALPYASWLANCTQAKLYVVHVSQREPAPVGELFDEEPRPDPGELDQLCSVLPEATDVECEHRMLTPEIGRVEEIDPAQAIVEFADKEHVDMIVLGTHGRSGWGHALMGSVAESVMRHAHCPVVTVRQPR